VFDSRVPEHCGIAGNEKVDMLAKQSSSSCSTGPEPSVGISVSTICSYISSWAVHEQKRPWHELTGRRQATVNSFFKNLIDHELVSL